MGSRRGERGLQASIDALWERWLRIAKAEAEANTGVQLPEDFGAPYSFKPLDPGQQAKTGRAGGRGGGSAAEPSASYVIAWVLRRTRECQARLADLRWNLHSPRAAEQARVWQSRAPQLRDLGIVPFLARPWEFGAEVGAWLCEQLCGMLVKARAAEARIQKSAMREELDESAACGSKAAFLFVKGADSVDAAGPINTASTARVLQQNCQTWGDLWQARGSGGGGRTAARAAPSFPPTSTCEKLSSTTSTCEKLSSTTSTCGKLSSTTSRAG